MQSAGAARWARRTRSSGTRSSARGPSSSVRPSSPPLSLVVSSSRPKLTPPCHRARAQTARTRAWRTGAATTCTTKGRASAGIGERASGRVERGVHRRVRLLGLAVRGRARERWSRAEQRARGARRGRGEPRLSLFESCDCAEQDGVEAEPGSTRGRGEMSLVSGGRGGSDEAATGGGSPSSSHHNPPPPGEDHLAQHEQRPQPRREGRRLGHGHPPPQEEVRRPPLLLASSSSRASAPQPLTGPADLQPQPPRRR